MNNKAYIEFWDITRGCGFADWEPETYLNVPEIGDIAYVRYENGAEELWKVVERIVYKTKICLYCEFHKSLRGPII